MGIYTRGIPQQIALDLADQYQLTTFIESGTHVGATSQWAANWFDTIYTIESEPYYYDLAAKKLQRYENIYQYMGKSEEVLAIILNRITENVLFWLDAHWSRDLKGRKPETICPVLQEIEAIKTYLPPHVIMIDDARLFTGNGGWPGIDDIFNALGYLYDIDIDQDVIIAKSFSG